MQISKNCYQKYIILAIFASMFLFSGCRPQVEKPKANGIIPVKAVRIELRNLDDTIDYVGNIKAQDEAVIYPKVSGKIIEKVKEDGASVNKGDVIAYIDRDEVGLKFEKAPVESTITGVIGRIDIDLGENVSPETAVALVVNMDKVKIDLDVPEKYLPKISLGQEAKITVDAYPGQEFLGNVTKFSPVVDLNTRTSPVEITIDNKEHLLKSGMFAKVSLIISKLTNVPVILKEAIMGRDGSLYVFVVEGSKSILKRISLGVRQGPFFEVKDGLKEGDYVVVMGQQKLYDGAQVNMEQ